MQCAYDFITYIFSAINHILEVATLVNVKITWIFPLFTYLCNLTAYIILDCFTNASFVR